MKRTTKQNMPKNSSKSKLILIRINMLKSKDASASVRQASIVWINIEVPFQSDVQ